MAKLDHSAAVAVIGLAVFQIADLWSDHAPSLSELRSAPPNDWSPGGALQKLQDADIQVGIVVGIVVFGVIYYTRDWKIALIIGATYAALSGWSHQVHAAPNR